MNKNLPKSALPAPGDRQLPLLMASEAEHQTAFSPTFSFPLSPLRQQTMDSLLNGNITANQVDALTHSSDLVDRMVGAHLGTLEAVRYAVDVDSLVNAMNEVHPLDTDMSHRTLIMSAAIGRAAMPVVEAISARQRSDHWIETARVVSARDAIERGEPRPRVSPLIESDAQNDPAAQKIRESLGLLASNGVMVDLVGGQMLNEKLRGVQEFDKALREHFGNKLIGISVGGSIAKGYANLESDVDVCVMGTDIDMAKFAEERAPSFGIKHFKAPDFLECPDLRPELRPHVKDAFFNPLYQGLFTGDRQALATAQANHIEDIEEKEWDTLRKNMLRREFFGDNIAERYQLEPLELELLQVMTMLQRIPPSYPEMQALLS